VVGRLCLYVQLIMHVVQLSLNRAKLYEFVKLQPLYYQFVAVLATAVALCRIICQDEN